jgi:rod shape determining protein RodA
MFDRRLLEGVDWVLLITVVSISIIGLFSVYSAAYSYGTQTTYFEKQILWFLLGLVVLVVTAMIDYRVIQRFSPLLHLVVILMLVFVLFYGMGNSSSQVDRWIRLGPFFLQPSEFVKYSLVLYLAYHFNESRRIGDLGLKDLIVPVAVTAIPFVLILQQPDLGSAIILLFGLIPIIFLVGIRLRIILVSGALALISLPFVWLFVLRPYQKNRIITFFNPELDPLGKGYQIIQSKIAVGSGQFWGKGYLQGTQVHLNFLPARHTDFIFSVFTEEWGFFGGVILVGLYLFLILWCLRHVGKTRDRSGTILTLGVTAIMASQIIVNIGMVLGLFPIVGMPLPFMSYGGSSMMTHMIGIGLILNVRMRRYDI